MNKKIVSFSLSLLVMALWGSLFPCVKIGYDTFGINSNSVADILMFAAMRFTLCGVLVCAFCFLRRKTMPMPKGLSMEEAHAILERGENIGKVVLRVFN